MEHQSVSAIYFAVHVDGQPDTAWEASRTAVQGPKTADDHVNLKSIQVGSDGRVFAAIKTSMGSSSAPLINLLVRDPATGAWASYRFGRVSDSHTRPIVMLDEEHRVIHMFATGPQPPNTSGQSGGTIYEKTSPLDAISFPDGYGTPVIRDAASAVMNNVTSTKQNVNSTTGLVVLATNDSTKRYWHAYQSLGGAPAPPVAAFSGVPTSGVEPLTVQFADLSTNSPTSWSWSFGDGGTSSSQNPSHLYAQPGVYDVSLTATNGGGSSSVTRAGYISVSAALSPPTAEFSAAPTSGSAPLTVQFTNLSSGDATSWAWDFQSDGIVDSTAPNPQFTYTSAGTYTVRLTATNGAGGDTATKADFITVDPPLAATTLAFAPIADAQVKSSNPTTNFGSLTTLRVREDSATSPITYRSYLKFSVVGITGTVTSVKLRLFAVTQSSRDGGNVYPVGNGWEESTIVWNNAPAIGLSSIGSAGPVTLDTWIEIPLSSGAVAADGTYSFALKSASTLSAFYNSGEATSNQPQLVLTQTTP